MVWEYTVNILMCSPQENIYRNWNFARTGASPTNLLSFSDPNAISLEIEKAKIIGGNWQILAIIKNACSLKYIKQKIKKLAKN